MTADTKPIIKTKLIQVAHLKLIKATVTVGSTTVISFSDAIEESSSIQDFARQATRRPIKQVS